MTRRIVLDASAAVHVVLRTEHALSLVAVLERASLVLAPDLFHSEVANSFWKYVRAEELSLDEAIEYYEEAVALVDAFHPASDLAIQALTAAVQSQHPVYDHLYAALARIQGCATLTMDRGFAGRLRETELAVLCPLLE